MQAESLEQASYHGLNMGVPVRMFRSYRYVSGKGTASMVGYLARAQFANRKYWKQVDF